MFMYFYPWSSEHSHVGLQTLVHLRSLESFTIYASTLHGSQPLLLSKDTDDLYEDPLWFTGASFYVFFTELARKDTLRTVPKIFLESNNTTIPFINDPNPESLKNLPRNAYSRSDLSRVGIIQAVIAILLRTRKSQSPVWTGMKWKDAKMGVAARLEWDSSFVRTGASNGKETKRPIGGERQMISEWELV